MRGSIVQLFKVTKYFGLNKVLDSINAEVSKGALVGLIGKSGAGKTTLLRIILGLYEPDLGFVKTPFNVKIGYASQEYSFYPRLTVGENLKYFAALYKVPRADVSQRIDYVLDLTDLSHARKTKGQNLSGGMKRRLDLALALIHDPDLLILDEPTTGLDVVLQKQLWENINAIHASGKTVIISSHDLSQLQKYCDDFIFIYNGKVHDLQSMQNIAKKKHSRLDSLFEECCR